MVMAAKKALAAARAMGGQSTSLMMTPEELHMTATRTNMSKAAGFDLI
jgi:hypothetical protein